jgi:prepilin-type N-terminal cleavage/methylation domain-containing protein
MEEGPRKQGGFTLLELMIATAVFLLICAAIFGLLELSQKNYGNESQTSGTFQEARLAVDQIVRDFDQAGYPSLGMFSETSPASAVNYAVAPVAWDPGYPTLTPCMIGTGGGGTCTTPGDFDLIVEADTGSGVSWIRYQLVNGTLYRAMVPKVAGGDPVAATTAAGVMVPFVSNVLNVPGAQLAEINATYPGMFPGGVPVPIFQYTCNTGGGTQPCPLAVGANSPYNVADVDVTLIVASPVRDTQTQRLKIVELNGRGHRLNPTN